MAFFTIALSVDYSLFLLSRYADERRAGATYRPALEEMVQHSGAVVLINGSIISSASLSGVCLPGGFQGVALATSVACVACMLWNLLVLPSIIGCVPWLFDYGSKWRKTDSP